MTVEQSGNVTRIETELYIKPINSGLILHYESAHPKSTKRNAARNQLRRAIRNSSNELKERHSVDKIHSILQQNGYPMKLLLRLFREARNGPKPVSRKQSKEHDGFDGFLCLPYVDEKFLCKIKSKAQKSGLNIKIAWKDNQKLKDKLIRSSLCQPQCPGGQRCHLCRSGFSGDFTQNHTTYTIRYDIRHTIYTTNYDAI